MSNERLPIIAEGLSFSIVSRRVDSPVFPDNFLFIGFQNRVHNAIQPGVNDRFAIIN